MTKSYDNLPIVSDNILALSHEIDAKSLIAGISCNITNVTNKDRLSNSEIGVKVAEEYHASLKKKTFLIIHNMGLYKKCSNATILLSALVDKMSLNCIKDLFKKFGQYFISHYSLKQWQMKILTTKMNQFILVNMLITNNNEPQLIILGDNLATLLRLKLSHSDITQSEYQRILKPLLQVRYVLNNDKVSDIYQQYIINLDNNIDMNLLMQHINKKFQEFLKQELTTRYTAKDLLDNMNDVFMLKEFSDETFEIDSDQDNSYYKKMITPDILVLDLNWFMSHLTNFNVYCVQLLTKVPSNIKDVIQYWLQQIQ